jgi:hypothetical protein
VLRVIVVSFGLCNRRPLKDKNVGLCALLTRVILQYSLTAVIFKEGRNL